MKFYFASQTRPDGRGSEQTTISKQIVMDSIADQ
jgi:hypothetical protein